MAAIIVADPGSCWRASPDEPLYAAWERARRLIVYAAEAGADVVKWQLLRLSIYPDGSAPEALIRPYCLPEEWLPRLRDACADEGIQFACTVYRPEDVPLVDRLAVPFHKVASFEHGRGDLLWACMDTGKPVLVSCGAGGSCWAVDEAVHSNARAGALRDQDWQSWPTGNLRYLLCVSAYPAAPVDYNLGGLGQWPNSGGDYYGVSDHTPGLCHAVGAAAAALGAQYIEKHLRAPDSGTSPDAHFAALPEEFAGYVRLIREVESTLADGDRDLADEWTWARWDPRTGRRGVPAAIRGEI